MDLYGQIRERRRGRAEVRPARRPAVRQRPASTSARRSTRSSRTSSSSRGRWPGSTRRTSLGYDCHGLPIELKVDRELGAEEARDVGRRLPPRLPRVRRALHRRDDASEFQRLGVLGDWDHPYLTMDFRYQAAIARALGTFVEQGLVYKGKKPVHWCIHCRTALAEAEVEYEDHTSPSIYVEFPLAPESAGELATRVPALAGRDVSVLIWTTTPWTIPSNLAIAFHPGVRLRGVRRRRPRRDRRRSARARRSRQAVGTDVRRAGRADEGRGARAHPLPASALRARLARRARRLRHARSGHRRGAHRAGPRRRRLQHRHASTASRSTRRSDPAGTSSTRSSCSAASACSTRTRTSRRR